MNLKKLQDDAISSILKDALKADGEQAKKKIGGAMIIKIAKPAMKMESEQEETEDESEEMDYKNNPIFEGLDIPDETKKILCERMKGKM